MGVVQMPVVKTEVGHAETVDVVVAHAHDDETMADAEPDADGADAEDEVGGDVDPDVAVHSQTATENGANGNVVSGAGVVPDSDAVPSEAVPEEDSQSVQVVENDAAVSNLLG